MDSITNNLNNHKKTPSANSGNDASMQISDLKKQLEIQIFLAKKYKADYDIMLNFFNTGNLEIQKKNEELLNANLELGRFAYVVAHDLNAPLNTITNFIKIIFNKVSKSLDKEDLACFEFINKATSQMSTMIHETLAYSQVDNKDTKFESVDLNKTIKLIKDILLKDPNNKVEIVAEDLPTVIANKAMMYKLFLNIIQNGIKYNNSPIKKIKINSTLNASHYLFRIEDNGIGIKGIDTGKIFDMFSRLPNSIGFDGTGIGLAMCKKIIENHHGTIEVSPLPNGSQFNFSIKIKNHEE